MLQKANRLFDFKVNIVLPGLGPQTDFLEFGLMLLAILLSPLALLVFVLTEIHDPANGWLGLGCNFYQIQSLIPSFGQSVLGGNDSELLAILIDDTNWSNSNLVIDSV